MGDETVGTGDDGSVKLPSGIEAKRENWFGKKRVQVANAEGGTVSLTEEDVLSMLTMFGDTPVPPARAPTDPAPAP